MNYGLSLALQFNANLVLSHIVPPSTALTYTFLPETFAFEREQARHAEAMLPSSDSRRMSRPGPSETIVRIGDVRGELLGIVSDEKIDLVVMGTHGRNAFERFLLGSLTERIRSCANCLYPSSRSATSMPDEGNALFRPGPAAPYSVCNRPVRRCRCRIQTFVDLARGTGARLTVLHALRLCSKNLLGWRRPGHHGARIGHATRRCPDPPDANSIPKDWIEGVSVIPMPVKVMHSEKSCGLRTKTKRT